jgi:diguanylate cyclase (GGDEF)-like protein
MILREKAKNLPYVEALTLVSSEGELYNFSRSWPIPSVNVADRDYYKALVANPELDSFLSEPVQNRGTGTWTIYLARKMRDTHGNMLGMVLGAMRLDYFEEFYDSINTGAGSSISLFRSDGMLLVRNPPISNGVGKIYPRLNMAVTRSISSRDNQPVTHLSAADNQERLTTVKQLSRYPVVVTVSESLSSIAASWRPEGVVIGTGAVMLCVILGVCAFLGKRQLNIQYRLSDAANHMARHDALTGLPNRVLFSEHLRKLVQPGSRHPVPVAILLVDLDYFKSVNDTLGHPAGDSLLRLIAERLVRCVGPGNLVARLGGDEFCIIQQSPTSLAATHELAQRLVYAIGVPCNVDGNQIVTSASIGITSAPADGTDADQLLKNADLALYRAKAEGRCSWRVFEPSMQRYIQDRRVLELALRDALASDGFELHYQPVVDTHTSKLAGFEALLRWKKPIEGAPSASQFIPVAEETGLIVPLGKWVLEQACKAAAGWPPDVRVAVNVSAVQFRGGELINHVIGALAGGRLAPNRLELEITETVLLKEDAYVRTALDQLRRMGVRLSLDDFGTGYSSLSYLRRFPADRIKIDISFVKDICHDVDSARIVRAIVDLARSLGMSTTAEGVETLDQWQHLKEAGCDEIQGYFVGRPSPLSATSEFLKQYGSGMATKNI